MHCHHMLAVVEAIGVTTGLGFALYAVYRAVLDAAYATRRLRRTRKRTPIRLTS